MSRGVLDQEGGRGLKTIGGVSGGTSVGRDTRVVCVFEEGGIPTVWTVKETYLTNRKTRIPLKGQKFTVDRIHLGGTSSKGTRHRGRHGKEVPQIVSVVS